MRTYTVISYAYDWRKGAFQERRVPARDLASAEGIADAQYLGGEERVTIQDPKGHIEVHQYRKETLDA